MKFSRYVLPWQSYALSECFCFFLILSACSSEAHTSRDHFFSFYFSLDFHELWGSVMFTCLITEVKQRWAMLVLEWVTS